jgi:hypothetical protein
MTNLLGIASFFGVVIYGASREFANLPPAFSATNNSIPCDTQLKTPLAHVEGFFMDHCGFPILLGLRNVLVSSGGVVIVRRYARIEAYRPTQ